MKDMILSLLGSKHTSIAGLIVLACSLGEIWLPAYTEQFHKTREFAMSYGLLLAGDAIRKAKNGNTEITTKEEAGKKE